ncbi:MAG: carbohydrate ABC transporter permease [Dehalococcoidia bacterium]
MGHELAKGRTGPATLAPARRAGRWRRNLIWYAMIAPNVLLFAIFGLIPIGATVVISFTKWNILGSPSWIGFQNYQRLAQDTVFWTSLRVTISYVLLFVIPAAAISLGLAFLLSIAHKLQVFFRTVYFVPVVTSLTVIAMIWGWLLIPEETGPLNYLIRTVGVPAQSWLQDPVEALPAVTMVALWSAVGYYMVLWLAVLQAIPKEVIDAAAVDGANGWARFRHVTLPLLKPTTTFIIIVGTITAFQAFALFYLLTGGGPLYNTTSIVYLIYQTAFNLQQMGYASAMSMILVLVILCVALVQRRAVGGWSDELYG